MVKCTIQKKELLLFLCFYVVEPHKYIIILFILIKVFYEKYIHCRKKTINKLKCRFKDSDII
jgi:hypothetical protein